MDITYLKEHFEYVPETGKLLWKKVNSNAVKVGQEAGHLSQGYIRTYVKGKQVMVHKIIWALTYNEWPDGDIDHINMNRADNRLSNLRKVTRSENFYNRTKYKNNTTGYKGVTAHTVKNGTKFVARIRYDNKQKYIGIYNSPEEAKAAYDEAAKLYHGEYARL